ncbi:MAG: hexitol phosphatase HxpB [Flavipsychrobacter sp.]
MLNTAIYDMDGLLLDTEPLWGECMLRVAQHHGIPISRDKFKETTGLTIYEVTEYWAIKYPWSGASSIQVADDILDDIIATAKIKGSIMPGVLASIDMLKKEGYKIGLASSSTTRMIDELITHFDLKQYFDAVVSADMVELGKPHPAVFLSCAKQLNSTPLESVVFEDSINGVIAGKAARMKVIAVPDEIHYDNPRFAIADKKLSSLEELSMNLLRTI